MAIKIAVKYVNAVGANTAYPGGSFKNTTGPTTTDGTPLDKDWANDILGFREAVLAEAGIEHSGAADTAEASQVLDGLKELFPDKIATDSHVAAVAPHSGHVSHSLATAANDFVVASGPSVFIKKTLAQVKVILGLGDAAYKNTGTAAGQVAAGNHGHANDAVIGGPYSPSTHNHTGTYLSTIGTAVNASAIGGCKVIRGLVAADGTIVSGAGGFTVTKGGTGIYTLNYAGFSGIPTVMVNACKLEAADIYGNYLNNGARAQYSGRSSIACGILTGLITSSYDHEFLQPSDQNFEVIIIGAV